MRLLLDCNYAATLSYWHVSWRRASLTGLASDIGDGMAKWTAIWIKGSLVRSAALWRHWHDEVLAFAEQEGISITHIGTSSATFRSGKYLTLRRSRKRLQEAFAHSEPFDDLSFISVQEPIKTMIQDQCFGACLSRQDQDMLANFHTARFEDDQFERFEGLATGFFCTGRLERFQVGAGDLPVNYVLNFEEEGSEGRKEFTSLKVAEF
jgi:hypothetical protein